MTTRHPIADYLALDARIAAATVAYKKTPAGPRTSMGCCPLGVALSAAHPCDRYYTPGAYEATEAISYGCAYTDDEREALYIAVSSFIDTVDGGRMTIADLPAALGIDPDGGTT